MVVVVVVDGMVILCCCSDCHGWINGNEVRLVSKIVGLVASFLSENNGNLWLYMRHVVLVDDDGRHRPTFLRFIGKR